MHYQVEKNKNVLMNFNLIVYFGMISSTFILVKNMPQIFLSNSHTSLFTEFLTFLSQIYAENFNTYKSLFR